MGRLCMELVTLGALVGCGAAPTPCEDLGDGYSRLNLKAQACLAPGDTQGQSFDKKRCDQNIGKCSEPEKKALAELADCFRAAPACTPATEKDFNSDVFVCAVTAADKVGQDCLTILPEPPAQSVPDSALERILGTR